MTFAEDLNTVIKKYGLTISKNGDGFIIELPTIDNSSAKLDIGPDELDWYLTIQNKSLKKEYTDWLDYAGYSNDSKETLIRDKLADIEYFLISWTSAKGIKFEVQKSLFGLIRNVQALWNISGKWSLIRMTDLNGQ